MNYLPKHFYINLPNFILANDFSYMNLMMRGLISYEVLLIDPGGPIGYVVAIYGLRGSKKCCL